MRKIILLILCICSYVVINAQVTADNGLTALSSNVSLGGTLNNNATSIDFGSSNSNSSLLFKKGTSNYFFIGNDGKIGIGTNTPSYKLDVNGTGNFSGDIKVNNLVIGKGTGSYTTYNVALGDYVLQNNTSGGINTGVGSRVLYLNTTGSYNTGVGANALLYNTAGGYNTAVGYRALESNTTGGANTAVGYNAMPSNTTGEYNSAFGVNALSNNTTGTGNTAVGNIALGTNNTGSGNTSVGYWSLFYNTTGSGNTAQGGTAMTYNTTGSNNSALGGAALYLNTTGSSNASFGYYALFNNSTGNYNTAIGDNAGSSLTSGNSNIFIGRNVQPNISVTGSNQLNIGNWIYGNGGDIGIGVSSPSARLHVDGTVRFANLSSDNTLTNVLAVDGSGNVKLKSTSTLGGYWSPSGSNIYNNSGIVLIGTSTVPATSPADADIKLAVGGNVYAKKIKVTQTGWADYVFDPQYKLPTLKEVQGFIEKNKHLPDVPSASDVEKNGLDLGDNQATLLKKIEELTLYLIEQNKKMEEQQQQIKVLQQQQGTVKNLQEELEKVKLQLAGKK